MAEEASLMLSEAAVQHADDLSADSLVYHYPDTQRPAGRDAGEVAALKWAGVFRMPVFAILPSKKSGSLRSLRLSWVEDHEDEGRVFLLSFGDAPLGKPALESEDSPFFLTASSDERRAMRKVREGQAAFHMKVLHRYGSACSVCDLDVAELVEACHICPVSDAGTSDERNGLPLCVLHHRAFDRRLWAIEPSGTHLVGRPQGPSLKALGITRSSLKHLRAFPHPAALEHARRAFGGPGS